MKPVETFALKYNGTDLQILNQNRLPHQEQWRPITSAEDLKREKKKPKFTWIGSARSIGYFGWH